MKLTNELCPRSKALSLIDEGRITAEQLAEMCVGYMSHDDVEDMLDANELSDRFLWPMIPFEGEVIAKSED